MHIFDVDHDLGESKIVVYVEGCWTGHKFYHRLEWDHRGRHVRDSVPGCDWNEASQEEALSLLLHNYGILPRLVWFEVH